MLVLVSPPALVATWYAKGLKNPDAYTAASRVIPRRAKVLVCHGPRSVVVTINDWVEEPTVDLDLSRGAFRELALLSTGKINVCVGVLWLPNPKSSARFVRWPWIVWESPTSSWLPQAEPASLIDCSLSPVGDRFWWSSRPPVKPPVRIKPGSTTYSANSATR